MCGTKLAVHILPFSFLECAGRVDPLELVFPGGDDSDAIRLYKDSVVARVFNALLGARLQALLADCMPVVAGSDGLRWVAGRDGLPGYWLRWVDGVVGGERL